MTRAEILTACIAAGIITKPPYSVNPNPPFLAKYSAMITLASDQKGRNQARAEINRMIKRVQAGKDPIADARGGKRDGAGRKNRAIVTRNSDEKQMTSTASFCKIEAYNRQGETKWKIS